MISVADEDLFGLLQVVFMNQMTTKISQDEQSKLIPALGKLFSDFPVISFSLDQYLVLDTTAVNSCLQSSRLLCVEMLLDARLINRSKLIVATCILICIDVDLTCVQ